MPDEGYWHTFFNAEEVLKLLVRVDKPSKILEFGSGYGTFTMPLAQLGHEVIGLDIEAELVAELNRIASLNQVLKLSASVRDFVMDGTGVSDNSIDHALLYNILHIENPVSLLREAWRILKFGASASVIHWRSDIPTPRGPSLEIRPSADQCSEWAIQAGFHEVQSVSLGEYAPYHYGLILHKR